MNAKDITALSLYIHVPFCARKCNYCDFYSVVFSESGADSFIDAVLIEWELIKEKYSLEGIPLSTLYFGGGTPSILSYRQWEKIIKKLIRRLSLVPDYEWTIECNPDSFSPETASLWLDSGVTRLSLGVQSFDENELRLLGRIHSARQAISLLGNPLLSKFKSIGVDLMYGIPGQTLDSLATSLDTALAVASLRHLSAYELTISEHTDFGGRRGLLPLPSEETIVAMTDLIIKKTQDRGFERYEISNFGLPGHFCRHNKAYWEHQPYIGLGPGAHSYVPPLRFSNRSDVGEYTNTLRDRELPRSFTETVDASALSREMLFLGLRTKEGVNETDFRRVTGFDFASQARLPVLTEFVRRGMLEHSPPSWRLTDKGMLFADAVARDLL